MSKRTQMIGLGSCMALFILLGVYWHPFSSSECEDTTVNKICSVLDTQSVTRSFYGFPTRAPNGMFLSYFEVNRSGYDEYEITNHGTIIIRLDNWLRRPVRGELNGAELSWRHSLQL